MEKVAFVAFPLLVGFICGFFLTIPVNIIITIAAIGIAAYFLITTWNAELGALIGILAVVVAGYFLLALWLTVFAVYFSGHMINLSWLLRS